MAKKRKGNVRGLVGWVGKVGFSTCVRRAARHVTNAKKV